MATALAPPLIFTGLFVFLWCWKCTMLVIFQNTIIYNPFLPPDSRSLTIREFAKDCGSVKWREERIRSLDDTELALCVTEMEPRVNPGRPLTPLYILYFQGNASSLPPRLPDLSAIVRRWNDTNDQYHLTMACLSYRGYWTSHDRPSEKGINMDARAVLRWLSHRHDSTWSQSTQRLPVTLLWGQSIGCGFATNLAAAEPVSGELPVDGLILETPFTNTRAMLKALYPQKWLPYQYLWPFLRNHLDSLGNLDIIASRKGTDGKPPKVFIVEAAKDELVPSDHGSVLEDRCRRVGIPVERHRIERALHNDVMVRQAGKLAIARGIASATLQRGTQL